MCRFLAYRGEPILLETLIASPLHSLIAQSLHCDEGKAATNGDGFGIGWYGERPEPGLFRDLRPAWSDENLLSLCAQVRARSFFAHVRAATGTATARANCHPFASGRHLFMQNGQIGGWMAIRRGVEALIPDALYAQRAGTTDSEALLLAALGAGLECDPVGAVRLTVSRVRGLMDAAGIAEPLRFTAALTDGDTLWAFRWSTDHRPATLYWRLRPEGLVVVSEPLEGAREDWTEVPPGSVLIAAGPGRPTIVPMAAAPAAGSALAA
ncbi:MAG TPA: class II glutamine amidotransferase [Acetobacteraceae bacterium]|jgi:glutamine amidotransferase|nr:class II glutamine amidotransferase [Acetobacteraceae bacterium]